MGAAREVADLVDLLLFYGLETPWICFGSNLVRFAASDWNRLCRKTDMELKLLETVNVTNDKHLSLKKF